MGSAASTLSLAEQASIRHVLLSHAHLDHIKDLPFVIENVFRPGGDPLQVYAMAATLDALRSHIFNDAVWPDFTVLPTPDDGVLEYHELVFGQPMQVGALQVTAFPVNHPGGCAGFLLDSGDGILVVSGDTGPTQELWNAVNARAPHVRAVLVETSFPNRLNSLADVSGHLTPARLQRELEKLHLSDVPVYVYHIKEPTRAETVAELEQLGDARLRILEPGTTIDF
jgi:cAMP phosphodiesterase